MGMQIDVHDDEGVGTNSAHLIWRSPLKPANSTPTTRSPTVMPTFDPTESPTKSPSIYPTLSPTNPPSNFPTINSTLSPTDPVTEWKNIGGSLTRISIGNSGIWGVNSG